LGGFAQWRDSLGELEFELGARVDRTDQSAGTPQLGAAVPMGPRGLAAAFTAADRERSETTVDGVLRAWIPIGSVTPRITLARKNRVPSLLERFGWLPTEASFGLADGNIYVGNLDLEPETAWIAEVGFDLETDVFSLRPTLFYRRVDNFIQGVPVDTTVGVVDSPVEMIAAMNGDTTPLRFDNVDAELYGADLDFSIRPIEDEPAHWSPEVLGTTIIQTNAKPAERLLSDLSSSTVHSCACSDGLHYVLTSTFGRYRLWQSDLAVGLSPAFLIPDDALASLRSEALYRFQLACAGQRAAFQTSNFSPSEYQRRRLANMLAMLDAREAGATIRELAFTLVYPNSRLLRGAEWKASGEKRHVLRLLRAALKLRDGGYRGFPGFDRSI